MEIKKSPKADLERGKSLSILMGFVVGCLVRGLRMEHPRCNGRSG